MHPSDISRPATHKTALTEATSLASLLRLPEVARRLSVSNRTVWSLITSGQQRVCRQRPKLVRIAEADLAEFIARRRERR